MDRRIAFFLTAGVACLLLTFPAPADLRRVPVVVAAVYFVLAGLTALELWSESRRRRREPEA